MEVNGSQDGPIVAIFEADVFEGDLASDGLAQSLAPVWIGRFRSGIEDVKDAFACRTRGLEHLIEAVQSPDRFIKEGEKEEETNQLS
jgi:hypothetical protein